MLPTTTTVLVLFLFPRLLLLDDRLLNGVQFFLKGLKELRVAIVEELAVRIGLLNSLRLDGVLA